MTESISTFNAADPSKPLRLALLEDDDLLRDRVLAPKLRQFGFDVATAGSMAEMRMVLASRSPDIILLVVAALLVFSSLGSRMFWGSEGRWAEVTREMMLTGDYFHP